MLAIFSEIKFHTGEHYVNSGAKRFAVVEGDPLQVSCRIIRERYNGSKVATDLIMKQGNVTLTDDLVYNVSYTGDDVKTVTVQNVLAHLGQAPYYCQLEEPGVIPVHALLYVISEYIAFILHII